MGNTSPPTKEEDIIFGYLVALGIGLYAIMLWPSGSLIMHDDRSTLNLYQEHSDAPIKLLLERALNRALMESHGIMPPFYTTTIQQICGVISKLTETLHTATLERSLSVSIKLHQRAPTQQTKQEITQLSQAMFRQLDDFSFEIELKKWAKFDAFLTDMVPFIILLCISGFLFLILAIISNKKTALLFVLYIPPLISILANRGKTNNQNTPFFVIVILINRFFLFIKKGWIKEERFNPFSITLKHTQSHVGYNSAMQALLQRLPSLDAKTNSHTNKSSSMFEIESTVLKQNSTLRQYFNGSSSRKGVFALLNLANLIHTLRYHLINEYIIGMVGTSNTGKSSLCNKIWNLDTSPSIVNRTVNAQLFYLPEQVSV